MTHEDHALGVNTGVDSEGAAAGYCQLTTPLIVGSHFLGRLEQYTPWLPQTFNERLTFQLG